MSSTLGILLRAKRECYPLSMQQAIERMRNRGIRLSDTVVNFALREAGESGWVRSLVVAVNKFDRL